MITSAMAFAAQPNIAIFYAADPPWDELHAFDGANAMSFNAILKNRNLDTWRQSCSWRQNIP